MDYNQLITTQTRINQGEFREIIDEQNQYLKIPIY